MLIGVVGKANVGKSTFFKATTLAEVLIANYPFATIAPNRGAGYVKIPCVDTFFKVQCNPREGFCLKHNRFVPVEMIDVAGLVPGAHEGKGMGNQFLSDLNMANALIHVIDVSGSTNEKGEPVPPGTRDPTEDIKFLEEELDFWYLDIMKKTWGRFSRQVQQEHADVDRAIAKQLSGMGVDELMVKDSIEKLRLDRGRILEWTEDDLHHLASLLRKKAKPMIIAANKIDVSTGKENYERLQKEFPEYLIVPVSAESELALKEAAKHNLIEYVPGENNYEITGSLSDKQQAALAFIKTTVLDQGGSTGVQDVLNRAVFELLKYKAVFPGGMHKLEDQYGRVLPDCFLLPGTTTALEFAYKLHTDFGKNFVKAMDVKKRLPIGKDHVLQHLDVIEIMSNK
ncbi:MAG: redox-regulated ATPase YchF [archaeon]